MSAKPSPQPMFQQCASWWQSSADYQQTVASIMNLRGQCADSLTQATVNACQQASHCQSLPQLIGVWGTWQASYLTQLTNLALDTHVARQQLLSAWQQQGQRWLQGCTVAMTPATPQQAATTMAPPATNATPKPATPQPRTEPVSAPPTSIPAPTPKAPSVPLSHAAPLPLERPTPQAVTPASVVTQPMAPVVAAAPTQVANTTPEPAPSNAPLPLHVISRTGDASVVRSGNGATIAAASATRRSVLARRQQRKSGLARAR